MRKLMLVFVLGLASLGLTGGTAQANDCGLTAQNPVWDVTPWTMQYSWYWFPSLCRDNIQVGGVYFGLQSFWNGAWWDNADNGTYAQPLGITAHNVGMPVPQTYTYFNVDCVPYTSTQFYRSYAYMVYKNSLGQWTTGPTRYSGAPIYDCGP